MMRNHTNKLISISRQTDIPLEKLVNTYNNKITQYVYKDIKQGKEFNYTLAFSQRNRAMDVMEGYAARKLDYKQPPDFNDYHAW